MIQSAQRIENYHYAIRHLVGAAEALTRAGRRGHLSEHRRSTGLWLSPSEHIVEPVIRALKIASPGTRTRPASPKPEKRSRIMRRAWEHDQR